MKIKIRRFDVNSIKPDRIILLVGKRGTGKSTLLEDILYNIEPKLDLALAMTPTEESSRMFEKHIPRSWIYDNYSEKKVVDIIETQRLMSKRHKQRNLCLALDDCMYDKKILRSTSIRDVFMNGRHLKLTVVLAAQYVMDMGPDLRSQVDYVFALRENIISNRVRLYKYFFGMFTKYEDFGKVMDACTENFHCLVLDNTCRSNNISDCLFWYKADDKVPDFQIGTMQLRSLAQSLTKSECEIRQEEETRRQVERMQSRRAASDGRVTDVECLR